MLKSSESLIDEVTRLRSRIQDIKDVAKIQCSDGNWNYDDYMYGMANGMILCEGILEGTKDIEFLEAPDKLLVDKKITEEPKVSTEKIIQSAVKIAQITKQDLFHFGASSPDGDMRYGDSIDGVIDGDTIKAYHTSRGAAGGMDSYTEGVDNRELVDTLKLPVSSVKLINFVRGLFRFGVYLRYVKEKNILWLKRESGAVKGLNGLKKETVDEVLRSYGIEANTKTFGVWNKENQQNLERAYKRYKELMKKVKDKGREGRYYTLDEYAQKLYKIYREDLTIDWKQAFRNGLIRGLVSNKQLKRWGSLKAANRQFGVQTIDIRKEFYNKSTKTFSFDASDVDATGGHFPVYLRNPETGNKIKFNWVKTDYDGSHEDIYGWHYVSEDRQYKLLIAND